MTVGPSVTPELLTVELGTGVFAGFTTGAGGTSTGPWRGLNLAHHVGDDPGAVAQNRQALQTALGVPVQFVNQVHGTRVLVVDPAASPTDLTAPRTAAQADDGDVDEGHDAVLLRGAGTAGAVMVADCAPVLLADPRARIVAAAHAGRVGLLGGVLQATVERMVAFGAVPDRVRAVVGPCAGPCCYEVPEDLRRSAAEILPDTWARTRTGTPAIDLRAGCRQALAGVGVRQVEVLPVCTVEDERLYSYRRSRTTGRFVGVIGLLP